MLGRLVQISAATGAGAGLNTYGYTYDAAGQRTQEASTVGTRDFAYDNQRQLTSAYRVDSSGQPLANYNYSFTYDPIGNWQSETANGATTTFTANSLNQYTAITNGKLAAPQNPSYDANGNMTSDGQGNSFVYDEENRLIEADTPGNSSLAKVVSVYDGLSRRVEKRAYDSSGNLLSTTRYLYDGLLPIAEADANNVIQRTYTRGLDLSGTMQGAGGIGGLLALTDGTGSYSYFCDGNGNVVDLTNAYGVNVSHLEYDPFGNSIASTGTLSQPYQWSSKENDGNGLVYYLYRFYNPAIGRWQNRDPIGVTGGLNELNFINNALVNIVDAHGLCSCGVKPGSFFYSVSAPTVSADGSTIDYHLQIHAKYLDDGTHKPGCCRFVQTEQGTAGYFLPSPSGGRIGHPFHAPSPLDGMPHTDTKTWDPNADKNPADDKYSKPGDSSAPADPNSKTGYHQPTPGGDIINTDTPHFPGIPSGAELDIQIKFFGTIYDTCNGNNKVESTSNIAKIEASPGWFSPNINATTSPNQ